MEIARVLAGDRAADGPPGRVSPHRAVGSGPTVGPASRNPHGPWRRSPSALHGSCTLMREGAGGDPSGNAWPGDVSSPGVSPPRGTCPCPRSSLPSTSPPTRRLRPRSKTSRATRSRSRRCAIGWRLEAYKPRDRGEPAERPTGRRSWVRPSLSRPEIRHRSPIPGWPGSPCVGQHGFRRSRPFPGIAASLPRWGSNDGQSARRIRDTSPPRDICHKHIQMQHI